MHNLTIYTFVSQNVFTLTVTDFSVVVLTLSKIILFGLLNETPAKNEIAVGADENVLP
jgi:hypothetical protein